MVKTKKRKKPQIGVWIVVAVLSFIFVYPFWQTLMLSFTDAVTANQGGFHFWPTNFNLDAYKKVFAGDSIFVGYKNTLIRTALGTLLTLVVTFCAAYGMADKNLPGWSIFNFLIVFTMFFGGGVVPTYLNLKALGLINTIWVLILPGAAGAWNFIIMRNFVSAISKEIQEAALIDGASTFKTMVLVVLPLSKPVMAVIGLWSAVGHWNAWFDALTYANTTKLVVLQTVIRRLIDQGDDAIASGELLTMAEATPQTIRAATVMVATLPILLGYPFIQKYLVKGTMVGAVKG